MEEYDILVLGGGPAGISAALRAAENGARVCLVEKERLGNFYLHQGFFPVREVLRSLALMNQTSARAGTLMGQDGKPDFLRLFGRAEERALEASGRWQTQLTNYGVHLRQGRGSLLSSRQISLAVDGKETTIQAGKIILATGATPQSPATVPLDGEQILSPADVWTLKEIPDSILILGGKGYALELALLFNRLGSKVFYCTETDRLLPGLDPELSACLEESLKKQKIKLLLNKKILSYYKEDGNMDINLDGGVRFSVRKILICGKRRGAIEGLNLDGLGIRLGEAREVLVDQSLATSTDGVFAAGSITGAEFVDFSEEQGRVAADNAMGKNKPLNVDWIPRIVFVQPEVASVGCTIEDAHHRGFRAVAGRFESGKIENALIPGETGSLFKVVADKKTRAIIGGQIVSPGASESISLILLAIRRGLTTGALASLPCATTSETHGIREAARACERALKAQLKA